jgi:hypothetical protein
MVYLSLTTDYVVVLKYLCQAKIHIWHALSTKQTCQALDHSEFSWTEFCYNVDRCVIVCDLLGYNTVQSGGLLPVLQMNLLPPFSG